MLKRLYQDHPSFETFGSACGRVSGKLKHTILACLTPPTVRTQARFMYLQRLFTWADRLLKLSPPGGAKTGSTLAKLRACLDQLPACKALIKRFRADALGLLECQKILKLKGLSHGSCTRPLRIIQLVLKPGKVPSYHNDLRGHCHGVTPVLLPTRSIGAHMALHHVASQLARAKRDPANPTTPAHQAQAQAFH